MIDDTLLLRRYVEERSEAAFTELVQRHVNLVYFAALRRTGGDAHRAEEIAQRVFATLAQKAPTLTGHTALTGWLYTATQFAVREVLRAEVRRQKREQEAYAMNDALSDTAREPDWNQVRPVIDDALHDLDPDDRDAVLLRFFENRPYAEIGAALHLTENSARMRVDRALEKLRRALAARGVTSTPAALAGALAVPAALAAPAGLAEQFATAALASAGATAAGGLTLFSLIKIMTTAKSTAIVAGAAAIVAAGLAVNQHQQIAASRAELAAAASRQSLLQAQVDDLERRLSAEHERAAKTSTAAAATPVEAGRNALTPPANPVTADQVEARKKKAVELAAAGRYPEALTEYLWCYDTGMRQVDGYFLTRYSWLLDQIAALGKKYPPALEALRQRRDAAKDRLLASATDLASGKDYGQINRVLGEDATTQALFDSLPEDDPRRGFIIESSMGRLLETQRYREYAKAMPYEGMPNAWEEMMGIAHSPAPSEAVRTQRNQNFIRFAGDQIEIRAGAGDLVSASDMIERLLIFDNSPETTGLIKKRLERAGHPDLFKTP